MDHNILVSDQESRMEGQNLGPRKPEEQKYASLPITETNSCDLSRIYTIRYARLCTCLKVVDIKDIWKPGKLSELLIDTKPSKIFLTYFQLRGQPTTVSNKAANLKRAVTHASLYFAEQPSLKAVAEEMSISLNVTLIRASGDSPDVAWDS
jgi:hypothetical protein